MSKYTEHSGNTAITQNNLLKFFDWDYLYLISSVVRKRLHNLLFRRVLRDGYICRLPHKARLSTSCKQSHPNTDVTSFLSKAHVLKHPIVISQIDLFDNPLRRMDISKWTDTCIKDVSNFHR